MLIASSCGENDATDSASDAGGGSGSRWVELLARIPATDTTSDFIVLDDFAAAAAYAETPAPDCATDVSSAYVFWNTLEFGPVVEDERGIRSRDREMEATPRLAFGSNLTDNHAWLEAWGFCPLQVAQAAVAGFGVDEIRVYSGSFDLAEADAAIRATSTEVEGFTAEGDDAMLIYTWASDAAEPIDAGG